MPAPPDSAEPGSGPAQPLKDSPGADTELRETQPAGRTGGAKQRDHDGEQGDCLGPTPTAAARRYRDRGEKTVHLGAAMSNLRALQFGARGQLLAALFVSCLARAH